MRSASALGAACLAAAVLAGGALGCGTRRFTDTTRTATEQLLVSASVDQAIRQLDFSFLEDRRIYIDDTRIDRVDRSYVTAALRAAAWREGCIVVDDRVEADYIVEVASGGVGVDRSEFVLGLPATALPTPYGAYQIPQAAAYSSTRQTGAARLSFVAYRRDDRRLFYASGPAFGFSDQRSWWLFGAGPAIRDNIQPPRRAENVARVPTGPAATVGTAEGARGEDDEDSQ